MRRIMYRTSRIIMCKLWIWNNPATLLSTLMRRESKLQNYTDGQKSFLPSHGSLLCRNRTSIFYSVNKIERRIKIIFFLTSFQLSFDQTLTNLKVFSYHVVHLEELLGRRFVSAIGHVFVEVSFLCTNELNDLNIKYTRTICAQWILLTNRRKVFPSIRGWSA